MREAEIELALEFLAAVQGEQTFEVVDDQGRRVSSLLYPHRGQMYIYSAELRLDRFAIGGSYGTSAFRRTTCTDSDWWPDISSEYVWLESQSQTKPKLERFDINLYYRALDLKWDNSKAIQEFLDFLRLSRQGKFYLDAFVGYQKQRAAIL